MALLDHLVPAFGAAQDDSGIASLPMGLWLRSTILPMVLDRSSLVSNVPMLQQIGRVRASGTDTFRRATPEDFRYRVIVREGVRRIEHARVMAEKDGSRLQVGCAMLSLPDSDLLAKIQHPAFVRSAEIDPKQDWKVEDAHSLDMGTAIVSGIATKIVLPGALFLGGLYALSRLANKAIDKRG